MVTDNRGEGHVGDDRGVAATAVRELLEGVRQSATLRAGTLTLIPLVAQRDEIKRQTGYLPLQEAVRRKVMAITEQAQAQVPELLATSTAEVPVVLVGGEQVIGGLQNRVLNTTILVAAGSKLPIPVTCVEAGRWHRASASEYAPIDESAPDSEGASADRSGSPAFTSDEAAYASLRKMHAKAVSASLSAGVGHRSDQRAVWGEVAYRVESTGSFSRSGAMQALYKAPEREHTLKETVEALPRPEGALGFVALLGSEVLGAELFSDEALADAYWQTLARSYAIEALDAGDRDGEDAGLGVSVDGAHLLEAALTAEVQVHQSPGLGEDARLVGAHVMGAGLVHDGAVVHMSVFPEDGDSGGGSAQRTRHRYGVQRQIAGEHDQ
jgi:hypothetical protein